MSESSEHEVASLIQDHPLFSQLNAAELAEISRLVVLRIVEKGEAIVVEGVEGSGWFVLQSGELRVVAAGNFITTLRPGACIGEMSMLDPGQRSATVTATRTSELLCFDREAFNALLAAGSLAAHKVMLELAKVVVRRLRDTLSGHAAPMPADVSETSFVMRRS